MLCCLPCIAIPFLMFIYHKFLQPYVIKFWRMWTGNQIMEPQEYSAPKCPCKATATEESATLTDSSGEKCTNTKSETCETIDNKKDD